MHGLQRRNQGIILGLIVRNQVSEVQLNDLPGLPGPVQRVAAVPLPRVAATAAVEDDYSENLPFIIIAPAFTGWQLLPKRPVSGSIIL